MRYAGRAMLTLATTSSHPQLAASLQRHFAAAVRLRGEGYLAAVDAKIDPLGGVIGSVAGSRAHPYAVRLMPSLRDVHRLIAACTCPAAELAPCKHLWALLRTIDQQRAWPDVPVPTSLELTAVDDPDLELIADREAAPIAAPTRAVAPMPSREPLRARLASWPRHAPAVAPGKPASVEYVVEAVPVAKLVAMRMPAPDRGCTITPMTVVRTRKGVVRRPAGKLDPSRLEASDAELRAHLFGVETLIGGGGSSLYQPWGDRIAVRVAARRLADVAPRLAATGRFGWLPARDGELAALVWDGDPPWSIELRAARGDGPFVRASGALVRGDERIALAELDAIGGGGLAIAGGRLLRVDGDGLARWVHLLASGLDVANGELAILLETACREPVPMRLDVAAAGWQIVDSAIARRLVIEPNGRGRFEARADFAYASHAHAVVIDASARRIVRRRLDDEHAAALELRELGGYLERPWSVSGSELRAFVERAAARGWEVWYDGARVRPGGQISAEITSGTDWFDVTIELRDDGATAAMPELLAALRAGRSLVRLSDGTAAFVPAWLEARAALLAGARDRGGALRFRPAETLVAAALLDGAAETRVDAAFARLRDRLDRVALAPRAAPRGFRAKLRDYQRDGLGWLHFLRELGLGGCLADDMGLGKTVQVLAVLDETRRAHPHKPSLVVAPRSLVFHWLDEARRFAPKLRTLEWHGTDRHARTSELAATDLVVTTYGTLRQDLERLATIDFDLVVLDEAHAIKTASTQIARAVRALRAGHRLALTGTPVENRLDDLASIFEFLNPGLLGRPAALRAIASVEPGADERAAGLARARALGRVLRPFLLRRTKEQVLAELPAKTEQVVGCRLARDERKRYDELRLHYRRALLPAVDRDGVGKNAIVVLEALLRLRQAALHPGLLDPRRIDDDSAKLDALVEHLHEAIASGHRALVFSQFTSLLAIVRGRLGREGIAFEYLDGQTRDRRARVAAFQTGGAHVFLLSLKAGGTGLNLTAADHVFLLDPWWNPAVEAQAIDRVHRIGQARPVTAYRLVAEDTVEQKILALQDHKRALFAGVFEDRGVVARMTANDLRALLD